MEDMCGLVVTIDAIHDAAGFRIDFFRVCVLVHIERGLAGFRVAVINPIHLLAAWVRPVPDSNARPDMSTVDAALAVSSADVHQEHRLRERIVFIVGVMRNDHQPVPCESGWPVALLAGLSRRTKVRDWHGNRAWINIED